MDKNNNLKNKIDQAIISYYGMEDPIMTDKEFDILFEQIYGKESSPFEIYQSIYSTSNRKRTLKKPMLSLTKVKTENDLSNWINKMKTAGSDKIFITPKFDGLACLIETDANSEILSATTRGNGKIGEDITYIVKNIPTNEFLQPNSLLQVELMLPKDNLSKASELNRKIKSESVKDPIKKKELLNNTPDYSNPRNAAAGLVRTSNKYTKEIAQLLKYTFHYAKDKYNSIEINITEDIDKILVKINEYHDSFMEEWYLNDGVVIVAEKNGKILTELGDDGSRPRYAVAWKFENVSKPAIIKDIIWQKGRVKNTPVAIFDPPVLFDGVTIERCTLHNQDYIDQLDIQVGDTVSLIRSNEVIPYITKVITQGANRYKVYDNNLEDNYLPLVEHWVKTLDIYGAGKQFCIDLSNYSKNLNSDNQEPQLAIIHAIKNIINDKEQLSQFNGLENENSKRKTLLFNEIKNKLNNSTNEQLLASLGLPLIGIRKSKTLLKDFSSYEEFINAIDTPEVFKKEGIKEKTIKPLTDNKNIIKESYNILYSEYVKNNNTVINNTNNKKIVITGGLDKPRKELEKDFLENGYEMTSSVSKETFALITPDPNTTSSKMTKAKKIGINIIISNNIKDVLNKLEELSQYKGLL